MRIRTHLACALLLLAGAVGRISAAEPVTSQAELDRVRALVRAGALPRNAIPEAEQQLEKSRLQKTVQDTLTQRELTEHDLPEMLNAAKRLDEMARDELRLMRGRVEAGALPVNELAGVKERADLAARQYELAQTRARLVREQAAMARAESRLDELEEEELAYVFQGDPFSHDDIAAVDEAFFEAFGVPLPVSANGYTAMHESMGFDHSGRLDVPLHPDDTEGMFLIELLETWGIPYIAFRSAVPGQSTGPHIHIGPRSDRILPAVLP